MRLYLDPTTPSKPLGCGSRGMVAEMTTTCSHHCRACGSCFTSLRAFDLHRAGPMSDRRCELGAQLIERTESCKLADPELPVGDVTVYARPDTAEFRKRMGAALTASGKLSASV